MGPVRCVNQLCGDAHPVSALSHRAFQHIPDAKLAPDLLHVDCLALVRKTRIASDDEEPANARERGDDLLDRRNIPARDRRLMLAKGRTAMEGLSGRGSGG